MILTLNIRLIVRTVVTTMNAGENGMKKDYRRLFTEQIVLLP